MAPTHSPAKKPTPKTSVDHVQEALGEIDKARQSAQGEARGQLDRATDRLGALATDLRDRAEEEARDFQASLDRAGEHLRVDLGLRAVRAQNTSEALTKLSAEIDKRQAELTKQQADDQPEKKAHAGANT